MELTAFIEACRKVCTIHGTDKHTRHFREGREYQDFTIQIECDTKSQKMEIVRLKNHNPVVMVNEIGEVYRSHGEVHHLHSHVNDLLILPFGGPAGIPA